MKVTRITAVLAAGVLACLPFVSPVAMAQPADQVSVDSVLVNRLGGVSVVGSMSCPQTAAQILAGTYQAQDMNENWVTVPVPVAGDAWLVLTNPDNYTISQPVGRRLTVQVTHESSRANACYVSEGGVTLPDGNYVAAEADGVYTWRTDEYGYDQNLGPYFDYSAHGKFAANRLAYNGHTEGAWILIRHDNAWSMYNQPEGFYVPYVGTTKATMAR